MSKVVIVTGGFDPLHSGHIAYFKAAKALGDHLVVGLNSDDWLTRKKGRPFMDIYERSRIIESLAVVDKVVCYPDADGSSKNTITGIRAMYPDAIIIFANGGDRTKENIPEMDLVDDNLEFVFGVGGEDKKNSSSWILKEWSQPTTQRAWGTYTILDKGNGWQVKQLTFDPNKSLSDQRHFKRSEHWHVVEGTVKMILEYANGDITYTTHTSGDSIDIPINTWHKAINVGTQAAKVIEVWLGNDLTEDDIERRD
jgi:cytidyltransferase-like protein